MHSLQRFLCKNKTMEPAVIFGSFNISTSITAYFGLIESVGGNVQKLLHAPFKSSVNNLKAANNSNSFQNSEFYIRQALIEFNEACTLEENENLISAYIGKAMCQHLLGDFANRDLTMLNIKEVKLSISEKTKAVSKTALKMFGLGPIFSAYKILNGEIPYISDYFNRLQKFEEYKQLALATK